jgi:hypothetical protein
LRYDRWIFITNDIPGILYLLNCQWYCKLCAEIASTLQQQHNDVDQYDQRVCCLNMRVTRTVGGQYWLDYSKCCHKGVLLSIIMVVTNEHIKLTEKVNSYKDVLSSKSLLYYYECIKMSHKRHKLFSIYFMEITVYKQNFTMNF